VMVMLVVVVGVTIHSDGHFSSDKE